MKVWLSQELCWAYLKFVFCYKSSFFTMCALIVQI